MTNRLRFTPGATALVLSAVWLVGCTTQPPVSPSPRGVSVQPAISTYRCGDEGEITIENAGSSVRVAVAGSDPVELAAAPPGQRSRYGADGYALVLDERDALWMKAGKTPLTCRR